MLVAGEGHEEELANGPYLGIWRRAAAAAAVAPVVLTPHKRGSDTERTRGKREARERK
jgi:hypothetical protein